MTIQLTFLPRETGEAFLEKRVALTSVVAGKDAHIPKSIALPSALTIFILEVGLRARRHDVCVCLLTYNNFTFIKYSLTLLHMTLSPNCFP